jgi:hypothetical protein
METEWKRSKIMSYRNFWIHSSSGKDYESKSLESAKIRAKRISSQSGEAVIKDEDGNIWFKYKDGKLVNE